MIDYLDEALWVPGMSCGILAHEQKYNEKIFTIAKRAFENLPDAIKPTTKTDTKYAYSFETRYDGQALDSSIYVATDVRSGTVQKLHITEAAWQKDPAKIAAGAKQAVPKTGSITEETTANGFNHFYDKFDESLTLQQQGAVGEFDYMPYFYPWFLDPEYSIPGTLPAPTAESVTKYGDEQKIQAEFNLTDGQMLWRRWKINELSEKQEGIGLSGLQLFMQEYPATIQEAFQSGAGNIFDVSAERHVAPLTRAQALAQLQSYSMLPADIDAAMQKYDALVKKGVWFWEMPRPKAKYALGCDPSDGTGSDYGPIDIWSKPENSLDKSRQCAQYYGMTRPDELAEIAAELGFFYNTAYAGIENNMLSTILFFIKIYPNYFFETEIDKKTAKKTKRIGWNTNGKTRDPMIDEFKRLYELGYLIIRSKVTISEMKTFVKNDKGKREHAVGKHDDALFAGFIAQQMIKLEPQKARVISGNSLS